MNQTSFFRMKRSSRMGTYGFVLGAVLLAVLIAANLLVGALPKKATVFDVSSIGITEISDETAKFVSGMEEDVTIYWLCMDGVVDDQMELLLTRYEEAGKHIRVEMVDTTANPDFAARYTDATPEDFSVIVESGRRFTIVNAADMYYYINDFVNEQLYSGTVMPMTEEQMQNIYNLCLQYYQIDITQYPTHLFFRGEALLTAALDYVTQEYIPHPYLLKGHGETAPSETLMGLLTSMGMSVGELDLNTVQDIPDDAGCLILFSPAEDLSDREAEMIGAYLDEGGSLMVNTSPALAGACPNLNRVCERFGLSALPGVVQEGDVSYISGSAYNLMPTVSTTHAVTAYLSQNGYKAQMPMSHAIATAEVLPVGVVVTPLLTTSATASRVDAEDTTRTLGTPGMLNVAVAATKSIGQANGTVKTAHLAWYGSADALADAAASATSGGNYYYYAATVSSMSEPFVSAYEGLTAAQLTSEGLTGMTDSAVLILGAVVVVVFPVALLVAGIVIWVCRKKR